MSRLLWIFMQDEQGLCKGLHNYWADAGDSVPQPQVSRLLWILMRGKIGGGFAKAGMDLCSCVPQSEASAVLAHVDVGEGGRFIIRPPSWQCTHAASPS